MEIDYHRLLWQELNKLYGGNSSVFVMAVGHTINCSTYDITGNAAMAACKTFELVDSAISCAVNYSPTGSSISYLWQTLCNAKGPRADSQHQPAFEEAKKALYKNFGKRERSKFYNDYCEKKEVIKEKIQKECKQQHGEDWEVHWADYFDKKYSSKEYEEIHELGKVIQRHSDAIDVWLDGTLAPDINRIKESALQNIVNLHIRT